MQTLYTAQEVQNMLDKQAVELLESALFTDCTKREDFIYEKLNEYNITKEDSPTLIFRAIRNVTGYSRKTVIKHTKKTKLVHIRHAGMKIACDFKERRTVEEIGIFFDRNHSTICFGRDKAKLMLAQNRKHKTFKDFKRIYDKISKEYYKLKNQQEL